MTKVVYAIRVSNLEYSGLKIMDVKIGKSTDIDRTISQYRRGNRNVELLDIWKPNTEKNLSTAERGVQKIAEEFAYDKQSEKFVFLQRSYQDFAETVNKILVNVSREELGKEDEPETEEKAREDYTGKTPAVIKFQGELFEVESWRECLQKVVKKVLQESNEGEKLLEIRGTKRDYFVREENQSDVVYPVNIPDTEFYFEGQLSANDVVRISKKVLRKYGYDASDLEVFTEEDRN